jgi:PAS domain S-box-containing protein
VTEASGPVDVTLRSIARLGIRPRLLLALPAFVLLVVGVGTVYHLSSLADLALGTMVQNGELIAQQVVTEVSAATAAAPARRPLATTLQKDRALTALFQSSVGYYPYVRAVLITDPDGKVIAHSTPDLVGDTLGPPAEAQGLLALQPVAKLQALYGDRDYEVVVPMSRARTTIGVVRVQLSNKLVRESLGATLRSTLVLSLLALLIALLMAVVLADLITNPLRKLTAGIERLGQGELGGQIENVGPEDLGQLVTSFNQMSLRLAEDRTQLEERSKRLAVLVDGIEDGILMADRGGSITLANPTACRILGRDEEALVGRDIVAALGPDHPLTELWRETMSGRDARERSEVRLDSDARGDRYLLLADPVPRGAEPHAAVLTLRNSDSLRKLTSLLDESHRMIAWGQVALGVAHEIKNPLQAMNLNLELAREKIARQSTSADMSGPLRNLGVVGQQIRRLDEVVNGFLKFARMTHAEREPLNVNGILSEIVNLVTHAAEAGGVEIRFTPRPGLPTIWGDRSLLYQAFLNQVQNAIQAGPHQGPIEIETEPAARGGVDVRVRDRGRGIPRLELAKVFDLFYTTREEGSGIGLAIVQRVLALHGGQVEIASNEGDGTTVSTWLPLNIPLNPPAEAAPVAVRQGAA